MSNIIKPASIRRKECIDKLCNTINEAGLPAFVVVDIVERLLTECRTLAEQEFRRDVEAYHEQAKHEQKEGDN